MKERQCGPCSECCFSVGVIEFDKRLFTHCPHEKTSKKGSCGVYAHRPPSCASFRCIWLNGNFDRKDRPDRLGIVLATAEIPEQIVVAWVRKDGAHERGRGHEVLTLLAQHLPVCILLRDGKKKFMFNEGMEQKVPDLLRKLSAFMPNRAAYRQLPVVQGDCR